MHKKQKAFQIDENDNVVTALCSITPGPVTIFGDSAAASISAIEQIPKGHKIALSDVTAGEEIMKYGVPIGRAKQKIKAGEWVHLHNIQSQYDERSEHLDPLTGAPKDTVYQ